MDISEAVLVVPDVIVVAAGVLLAVAVIFLGLTLFQRRRLAEQFAGLAADVALTEDVTGLGSWSHGINDASARWSPGLYKLFGVDPKTFVPAREAILSRVHPDDLPAFARIAAHEASGGQGGDAEVRLFCFDGSVKDVLVVVRFRKNRQGAPKDVVGVVFDISSRKAAQRMVALREEQLQLAMDAMDAMGAGVWNVDLVTDTRSASALWVKLLGRDPTSFTLTRENHYALTHPDDRERVHEAYRVHIAAAKPVDIEYRMRHADGRYIWIHSRGRVLHDGEGKPVRMIGTVVEVTARRQASKRLEKRALEATLLHEGVKLAAEADSLPAALEALISMVCRTIGWPTAHVFMVAPGGTELLSTDIWHDHDPARYAELRRINTGMKFEPGVGLPGNVWMAGRPIWSADIASDPNFAHLRDLAGLHTAVAFPIVVHGAVRAVIEFFSDRARPEDPDLVSVFESLGRQIGGVIERQESAENLKRQAREQYLLHVGMTLAAEAPSFEAIVQRTIDLVCQTIDWPIGHAYVLHDPEAGEMQPTNIWHLRDGAAYRPFREVTARTTFRKGQGLPGRVWETQRAAWIEDLAKDANFPHGKVLPGLSLRTAVCLPVHVGGVFRAVLEFFTDRPVARDMDLLRVFGTLGLQIGGMIERQEAYDELRRSRESLELAIQASEAGHFDIDARTGTSYWSPRVREILGITPADARMTLEMLARIVHPDERLEFLADLEEYRARRTPLNVEVRVRTPAGELVWVHIRAVCQLDKAGQPLRSVGFIRDISVQKMAQRALAESERKFRGLVEGSVQGLVIHRRYKPLFCNLAFAHQHGYATTEEVLALESLAIHRIPEDTYDIDDLWRRGLAGEFNGVAREIAILDRHGDRKWFETFWHMIDWEGEPACQMIVMDVTERKQRERQLAAARDRLKAQADELAALAQNLTFERKRAEDASAAKSQFLAMMSHELRTPMTGVLGMADLLLMSEQTAEQKELTQLLIRSARSLLDLLNDVLDFSKIEAGQLEIESIPFRLSDVIADVRNLFGALAADKGLSLEIRLPPTYWNRVIGDPKRLRQVLYNLIGNAVKFTAEGNVILGLAQERAEGGGLWLRFSISDTGIGISAQDRDRLFRPFMQADASTARKYGGTGLGLAISKRLVTAMGGDINVESARGSGSVFTFAIKVGHNRLGEGAARSGSIVVERAVPTAPAAPADKRRILVAEDSETSRRLITMMLTRLGHTVDAAQDGVEAVAMAKANVYDLILMDMQMPVMDGPDASREIRKIGGDRATIPIIALTADVIAHNRAAYFAAGINAIVAKPVDWAALEAEMARQMAGAAARGAAPAPPEAVSEPAPEPVSEVLDEGIIGGLLEALGEEALAPMITTFRSNMAQYRDELAAAVKAGDLRQAKRTAHALKGLCAQFGAPRASSIAKAIEADAGSLDEIAPLLAQVAAAVTDTERALAERFPRVVKI